MIRGSIKLGLTVALIAVLTSTCPAFDNSPAPAHQNLPTVTPPATSTWP